MFGIGTFELLLILVFGFLIFGPDKLPVIAKTVGQAINKFRNAQEEMSKVLKTEVYDPTSDEPFKNPLDTLAKVTGANTNDKGESFSERKDRYDRQREAKRKAEERKKATTTTVVSGGVVEKVIIDESKVEKKPVTQAEKPRPSADELYGNKPAATKVKTVAKTSTTTSVVEPAATAEKVSVSADSGSSVVPREAADRSSERKGE